MDSNIKVTPTSSTTTTGTMARSISTQPSSLSSEKSKYGFRQQLKRFVGWGSSKPKKPLLTPLTTSQNGPLDPPPPLTGSTLVSNSTLDSPSDMSFVSAPSTPLPPTPCTAHSTIKSRIEHPRLEPVLSRKTSDVTASEIAMSVISASKSRLSIVSSLSTCSVTTEELSAQDKVYISDSDSDDSDDDDDEDDAVSAQEEIVQEQIEMQNEDISDDITEEKTEIKNIQYIADTTESIVDPEQVVQDTTKEELQIQTVVMTMPPPPPPKGNPGEFNDIQAQYAMWMNSQPPEKPSFAKNEQLPPTPVSSIHSPLTKNVLKNKPSAISEKSMMTTSSSIPSIPPSNNNSNNGNNNTNTMMTSPSNVSTSSSSCASTCSGTTAFTAVSTHKPKEMTREFQEPLHPMPSNNEQDLDDLFLLVAHGVDFLTTKENTKWEEEGGYEFHPWNRPQGSFAVRKDNKIKKPTQVPAELTQTGKIPEEETEDVLEEVLEEKVEQEEEEEVEDNLPEEESVASQESLVSVAKRILGAKSEPQTTQQSFNSASNEHQSVDDDELQRIVSSHIVF